MTTKEFAACFEQYENITITLIENDTCPWISSLEGALHFHTRSDAYYYFYNIIVLNLFIILVQLLESSCVRMLWRATK
jgi:hypothetical protein